MVVLFLFNLQFSPFRLLFYVSMLSIMFVAYLFLYFLNGKKDRRSLILQKLGLRISILVIVLSTLFLAGILNLYPSPYNLSMSYHATQMEATGMMFYFDYRNENVPLTGITVAPGRFAVALLSPEEAVAQRLPLHIEDQRVPWHFGYNLYLSLLYSYDCEIYLIITKRDKLMYVDALPEVAEYRFTNQDFDRLNDDPNLYVLYSNGEFDLYLLTKM